MGGWGRRCGKNRAVRRIGQGVENSRPALSLELAVSALRYVSNSRRPNISTWRAKETSEHCEHTMTRSNNSKALSAAEDAEMAAAELRDTPEKKRARMDELQERA